MQKNDPSFGLLSAITDYAKYSDEFLWSIVGAVLKLFRSDARRRR